MGGGGGASAPEHKLMKAKHNDTAHDTSHTAALFPFLLFHLGPQLEPRLEVGPLGVLVLQQALPRLVVFCARTYACQIDR